MQNYPTDTSPCPSTSADHSLYKFKNNIKQRFTAEHSSSGYISAPPTKKSKSSETTAKEEDSPSNDSHCESRNEYPSDPSRHFDSAPCSVAIFALHGDGTYYIPLTVDYSSLAPYLGAYSLRRSSRSPVLHPVTLSVCFQQNGSHFTRYNTVSAASSDFSRRSLVNMQK